MNSWSKQVRGFSRKSSVHPPIVIYTTPNPRQGLLVTLMMSSLTDPGRNATLPFPAVPLQTFSTPRIISCKGHQSLRERTLTIRSFYKFQIWQIYYPSILPQVLAGRLSQICSRRTERPKCFQVICLYPFALLFIRSFIYIIRASNDLPELSASNIPRYPWPTSCHQTFTANSLWRVELVIDTLNRLSGGIRINGRLRPSCNGLAKFSRGDIATGDRGKLET